MNTPHRLIAVFLISCFCFAGLKAQWTDHFDDICSLSEWADIQVTEGWDIQSLEEHNISATYPGHFMMMPYTVSWYANWRGPLMYRMAEGDFVLTTHIRTTNRAEDDIPGSAYSLGGVMVRNPKSMTQGSDDWQSGEEDYVFLSIGRASNNHPSCPGCPAPHFEVKSTINSSSNLQVSSVDTNEVDIRMVRLDPYVLVLYRFPGQAWEVHHRYQRGDLEDTVQVGMVTYTDWNKVFTYEPAFHNSHVLNEDLEPDPSSNPGMPFSPDIITTYDFMELQNTSLPSAWTGLNLLNETDLPDEEILLHFGDTIPLPVPTDDATWLGRENQDWDDSDNWLSGSIPASSDTVRINSCACPEADCVLLPVGTTSISGLRVAPGAVLTIPVGALIQVDGPLVNDGTIIIDGELLVTDDTENAVTNRGEIDCRPGGTFTITE